MRQWNRLTARQVTNIKKPGRYHDGGGLVLRVDADGNKSFGLLWMRDRRSRYMGLGPTRAVPLSLARELAAQAREQLARGLDPLVERKRAAAARQAEAARLITFAQAAEQYIIDHGPRWRNEQHRRDWHSSLRMYINPVLGKLAVGDVDLPSVLKVLQPLWRSSPNTGWRCRGRIEQILDWSIAREFREGPNPARWRGHLDKLLPPVNAVAPIKHQPSLPWAETPAFMADLRQREGVQARALEFVILTAARVSEVVNMRWSEVDFQRKVWTAPASKMKANREHEVPLSDRALALLQAMPRTSERPFPTARPTIGLLLRKRMGLSGKVTIHGFRASFKTWATDTGAAPREVVEMALAHSIRDRTEASYTRTTALARRAVLMQAWADFLEGKAADKVVPIRKAAGRRRG